MDNIKYITVNQIIFLNKALIERYNKDEESKIVNEHSLESAAARPMQTVFGEDAYNTVEKKAAALCESLINNYPFLDGNKRTAFAAMYMFLHLNGYKLIAAEEATNMTLDIANSEVDLEDISNWIKSNIKVKSNNN